MRLICICLLSLFLFVSSKPVSLNDREIEVLYLCDISGMFEFNEEGRLGLATLSEFKRREVERLKASNGSVLLFTGGNVFGKGNSMRSNFKILNRVPFDAVFLTEGEISYLDSNPSLKALNLPLVSSRKNSFGIALNKIFEIGNIVLSVQEKAGQVSGGIDKQENVRIVFLQENLQETALAPSSDRLDILVGKRENFASYFYQGGVFFAECPSYINSVGKINLVFREGNLIRHSQEFVTLNAGRRNRSWIEPNREIVNELK